MRTGALIITICLSSAVAAGLPDDVLTCLKSAGAGYSLGRHVDPPFLRGDFDGDRKPDIAVLIANSSSGSRSPQGVAICLSGTPAAFVLGAGSTFHYMKDLDFTSWHVARGTQRFRRDAFVLEWESASGLVYWNGKRFVWRQLGD